LRAVLQTVAAARAALSGSVAAGVMPSALEMMDRLTLEAAERAASPGYPVGAGALLLGEGDGGVEQVGDDAAEIERICTECGAFEMRAATSDADRALLWK